MNLIQGARLLRRGHDFFISNSLAGGTLIKGGGHDDCPFNCSLQGARLLGVGTLIFLQKSAGGTFIRGGSLIGDPIVQAFFG